MKQKATHEANSQISDRWQAGIELVFFCGPCTKRDSAHRDMLIGGMKGQLNACRNKIVNEEEDEDGRAMGDGAKGTLKKREERRL